MKSTLTTIFLAICFFAGAQEITKFYDWQWKETTLPYARFYAVIKNQDSAWHRRDYYIKENRLQMDGYYTDSSCKVTHGQFYFYHSNGRLQSAGRYTDGKKTGTWVSYHGNGMMEDSAVYENGEVAGTYQSWHSNGYPADSSVYLVDGSGVSIQWFDNGVPSAAGRYAAGRRKHGTWQYFHRSGQLSCKETYNNGAPVSKSYFNEAGEPEEPRVTESAAEFPGGGAAWRKYMLKNLYFPDGYKLVNSDKVVVVLEAVIDENGKVSDVNVVSSFHPIFDQIAERMLRQSPKWKPAISYNRKVRYRVRQAVYFAQPGED